MAVRQTGRQIDFTDVVRDLRSSGSREPSVRGSQNLNSLIYFLSLVYYLPAFTVTTPSPLFLNETQIYFVLKK